MKKFKKLLIVFIILILGYSQKVNAAERIDLCEYKHGDKAVLKITYEPLLKSEYMPDINSSPGKWYIFYKKENSDKYEILQNKAHGPFDQAFFSNDIINFKNDKTKFPASFEEEFYCPDYVNIEYDGPWHRACFIDKKDSVTKGQCGDHGQIFEYNAVLSDTSTLYNEIEEYAQNTYFEKNDFTTISNELVKKRKNNSDFEVRDLIIEATKEYVKNDLLPKYKFGTQYATPKFIANIDKHVDNFKTTLVPKENSSFKKYIDQCKDEVTKIVADNSSIGAAISALNSKLPTATEEEKIEINKQIDEYKNQEKQNTERSHALNEGVTSVEFEDEPEIKFSDDTDCSGLLGPTVSKIVKNLFNFIKFAGPILVGIFTIIDFSKAALSGDAEDMKKAGNKLAKRLVFAILLFFIPMICNTLFDLTGVTVPDICIK